MIVCMCAGVSDRSVRAAIDGGASTVDEIAASCGAATGCGGCREMLGDFLREAEGKRPLPLLFATSPI